MSAPVNTPLWQREFPRMTDMPVLPAEWLDTSWHNDVMPCFERVIDGRAYRLWVDYPNYEHSEAAWMSVNHTGEFRRFMVERMSPGYPETGDCTSEAFAYFSHIGALDVCLASVRAGA